MDAACATSLMLCNNEALALWATRIYCSFKNLHAVIAVFANDNAPVPVNKNAKGTAELAVAAAVGADGSNMRAIAVPQHLHAMITAVSYKDVPGAVKGNAGRT